MQKMVLVAGSHGGIGSALVEALYKNNYQVITISRTHAKHDKDHGSENCVSEDYVSENQLSHRHLCIDLSDEENVATIRQWVKPVMPELVGIIHCAGVLYDDNNQPEKNVSQVTADWLNKSMMGNVIPHLHLAQAVAPLITSQSQLKWISLSAKVGSIEDNHLGGWYSYRMTKAALNMFIRTVSIEWQRRAKNCSVIAMHPGTTPSALSAPFTKNWPKEKLYSPAVTANRILAQFEKMDLTSSGHLYHHDGSIIPW